MVENMEVNDLQNLLNEALKCGVKRKELKEVADRKWIKPKYLTEPTNYLKIFFITAAIAVLYGSTLPKSAYKNPVKFLTNTFHTHVYDKNADCLVANTEALMEAARPMVNCKICEGVKEVPVFYNMSKEYFVKHHAYTGVPVLIKGAVKHWTALKTFNYKYFKTLYNEEALAEFDEKMCQFFGYKTNFRNFDQVFSMSKKRAELKKDQWYIGWSNCVEKVQTELRKHYQKPSFIPDDAESSILDWIFMGGSGRGALMHIDNVNRPSWQAMISGKKTWSLEPPPECELTCSPGLSATMEPGDILVCDTNKWFHTTYIHPGNLSITIGSEYD